MESSLVLPRPTALESNLFASPAENGNLRASLFTSVTSGARGDLRPGASVLSHRQYVDTAYVLNQEPHSIGFPARQRQEQGCQFCSYRLKWKAGLFV